MSCCRHADGALRQNDLDPGVTAPLRSDAFADPEK
jgi:hypothetical protein